MSDSDLKIFIVGPRGAGKTVFACMLNACAKKSGVSFKAGDWTTKEHFSKISEILFRQEWPLNNLRGECNKLRWEWELGSRRALFDLEDPAGEDIERAMRGEGDDLPILKSIQTADVLFVLVDLHGHQGDEAKKRAQNGWIVENVLRQAVNVRQLVIGFSKGDLIKHRLPTEYWTDKDKLMTLISETMPEFNLDAYRSQILNSKVQMMMFSAVATESYLDDKEVLRQRPRKPLESQGLEPFVKAITEAHGDKELDKLVQKVCSILKKVVTSKIFLGLLVLLLALWVWKAPSQSFRITFTTSANSGDEYQGREGTDAQVYLKLTGDKRESWRINFDGDFFERGAVDVFERNVWRVGTISEVVVGHDDSGTDEYGKPSGGWHLEKVEVEEWRDGSWGPKTTFPCGFWLDKTKGYGLERKLRKKY